MPRNPKVAVSKRKIICRTPFRRDSQTWAGKSHLHCSSAATAAAILKAYGWNSQLAVWKRANEKCGSQHTRTCCPMGELFHFFFVSSLLLCFFVSSLVFLCFFFDSSLFRLCFFFVSSLFRLCFFFVYFLFLCFFFVSLDLL